MFQVVPFEEDVDDGDLISFNAKVVEEDSLDDISDLVGTTIPVSLMVLLLKNKLKLFHPFQS